MRCPRCQELGLKSTVQQAQTGVCAPFGPPQEYWDEEGRLHVHERVDTYMPYRCSNGHEWQDTVHQCPSCDWRDEYHRNNWTEPIAA